jgi:predicted nucleic acid-binding protein
MSFLLDSNTCVAVVRNAPLVSGRCAQHRGSLYLSTVSVTEVTGWLLRARTPIRYGQVFLALVANLMLLDVTEPIAHRAAMIGSWLRQRNQRLGLADLLIAATALEHNLTLVTRSPRSFIAIPGLVVINWAVP